MDQLYERPRKNDVCYALVLVAVLAVSAVSLVLQLVALQDDGQVALAQAAKAAVERHAVRSVAPVEQERKS